MSHSHLNYRIEDVWAWEPIAYTWIADAPDEPAREEAWHRFSSVYPEFARETCGAFWTRIRNTHWHHKHHQKHEPQHHNY